VSEGLLALLPWLSALTTLGDFALKECLDSWTRLGLLVSKDVFSDEALAIFLQPSER
jgi:hypothetical protein